MSSSSAASPSTNHHKSFVPESSSSSSSLIVDDDVVDDNKQSHQNLKSSSSPSNNSNTLDSGQLSKFCLGCGDDVGANLGGYVDDLNGVVTVGKKPVHALAELELVFSVASDNQSQLTPTESSISRSSSQISGLNERCARFIHKLSSLIKRSLVQSGSTNNDDGVWEILRLLQLMQNRFISLDSKFSTSCVEPVAIIKSLNQHGFLELVKTLLHSAIKQCPSASCTLFSRIIACLLSILHLFVHFGYEFSKLEIRMLRAVKTRLVDWQFGVLRRIANADGNGIDENRHKHTSPVVNTPVDLQLSSNHSTNQTAHNHLGNSNNNYSSNSETNVHLFIQQSAQELVRLWTSQFLTQSQSTVSSLGKSIQDSSFAPQGSQTSSQEYDNKRVFSLKLDLESLSPSSSTETLTTEPPESNPSAQVKVPSSIIKQPSTNSTSPTQSSNPSSNQPPMSNSKTADVSYTEAGLFPKISSPKPSIASAIAATSRNSHVESVHTNGDGGVPTGISIGIQETAGQKRQSLDSDPIFSDNTLTPSSSSPPVVSRKEYTSPDQNRPRKKLKKKSVSWKPDDELCSIRTFRLDDSSVKVSPGAALSMEGLSSTENVFKWTRPALISDLAHKPPSTATPEAARQSQLVKENFTTVYYDESTIPDTPNEPHFLHNNATTLGSSLSLSLGNNASSYSDSQIKPIPLSGKDGNTKQPQSESANKGSNLSKLLSSLNGKSVSSGKNGTNTGISSNMPSTRQSLSVSSGVDVQAISKLLDRVQKFDASKSSSDIAGAQMTRIPNNQPFGAQSLYGNPFYQASSQALGFGPGNYVTNPLSALLQTPNTATPIGLGMGSAAGSQFARAGGAITSDDNTGNIFGGYAANNYQTMHTSAPYSQYHAHQSQGGYRAPPSSQMPGTTTGILASGPNQPVYGPTNNNHHHHHHHHHHPFQAHPPAFVQQNIAATRLVQTLPKQPSSALLQTKNSGGTKSAKAKKSKNNAASSSISSASKVSFGSRVTKANSVTKNRRNSKNNQHKKRQKNKRNNPKA